MPGEFEIIRELFSSHDQAPGIVLGVGDDCALIKRHGRRCLALTTDTMVEGRHFFAGTSPYLLGWRALAVNLSDLAAMGAKPYCCTLSLTLPEATADFLEPFAQGFFELAEREKISLIGGNLSAGPLSITVAAIGKVKEKRAMRRSNARAGDNIYVTGGLGASALHVKQGMGELRLSPELNNRALESSFLLPVRCTFARRLSRFCRCAIDVSDGVAGDLRHIVERSGVRAELYLDHLPLAGVLDCRESAGLLSFFERCTLAACGGCDYELLFTLPDEPELQEQLNALSHELQVPVTRIGRILPPDVGEADQDPGDPLTILFQGRAVTGLQAFEHF